MKLLLDEHYSPRIAQPLRAQGHDVLAVASQPALVGLRDRALFTAASEDGRALLTEDVSDFTRIATELAHMGKHHAGFIIANQARFPRSRDGMGRLVEALHELLATYPQDDGLVDRVVWLEPAAS